MGLPTSISQDSPVPGYSNSWSPGLFAQDNFRIFPRLTLNLGVRWDIQTPPTDPLNRGTSFQVGQQSTAVPAAPQGALFKGDPGITRGIVPVRWHHVSPRSEEHTSELQSHSDLVCRLLLEKKNKNVAVSEPERATDDSDDAEDTDRST